MVEDKVVFTMHALEQFSMRVRVPITESAEKIRTVWGYTKSIDRQRAYELTGDKSILSDKKNKNTKYYEVPLSLPEIKAIMGKDNHTPFDTMQGVFVVKGQDCVTFKTNMENAIYSKLHTFRYTKRFYDIEGSAYL